MEDHSRQNNASASERRFRTTRKMSPKNMKIFKTCNLCLSFFFLGQALAVTGPCLLDLQHLVQTDTQHIAFIYTAMPSGYLLGSILGGILLDAVKSKQAVMTVGNLIVSASMLAIPWIRNLATLIGIMVVKSMSAAVVTIGGNVLCLTLWGRDSGPFYQALHFTSGLGVLVAPLIAAPFLGDYREEDPTSLNLDNATYFTTLAASACHSNVEHTTPNVTYPFSIIGAFGIVVTLLFLAVCIVSPFEEQGPRNKGPEGSANASLGFLSTVVFLGFLLWVLGSGAETGYVQVLTTYAVKGRLQLSASTGSYMTSTFGAAFTISRLASIFLAIKVSSLTLIAYDLVISVIGSLVLLLFAAYEWSLWLASVLLGLGQGSLFSAVVVWLDTYIEVTNKMVSVFEVGAAIDQMVVQFTISYFIDTIPEILLYVVPATCISSAIIVFILFLFMRKRERKYTANKEPECPVASGSSSHM